MHWSLRRLGVGLLEPGRQRLAGCVLPDASRYPLKLISDFPWLLELLNTGRKRELSGPRPLRGVQVDSSKSTI